MSKEQFAALMPYISNDLMRMIIQMQHISEQDAIQRLYTSELYAALEDETTKVWQYSTPMLYALFEQEQRTGAIQFPDV